MDDEDRTTVHMFNLKTSHEGDYECYIKYSDSLVQTVMKLSVTGRRWQCSFSFMKLAVKFCAQPNVGETKNSFWTCCSLHSSAFSLYNVGMELKCYVPSNRWVLLLFRVC